MILSEAIELYAESALSRQRRGGATKRSLIAALKPMLSAEIGDISTEDIRRSIDAVSISAPVHAARMVGYLRPFFKWSNVKGFTTTDAARNLWPRQNLSSRHRVLGLNELRCICAAAETLGFPFGHAIRLMVLTSCWREDVGAMRVSEFSWLSSIRQRIWTPSRQQGGAPFHLVLPDQAQAIVADALASRHPGADLIFTTTGHTPVSGWSKAKRHLDGVIALQVGSGSPAVEEWRLNDLRQSFHFHATTALCVDPLVASACLNRMTPFSTALGREWAASDSMIVERQRALSRWADLVMGI